MGRRKYGTSVMNANDMGLTTMSMPPIEDDPEEDKGFTPDPPPQDKPIEDPPADDGRENGDSNEENGSGSEDYTLIGLAALAAIIMTILG